MTTAFALVKDGKVFVETIAERKSDVWCGSHWGHSGYDVVSRLEGQEWRQKYWKRLEASMESARRLGYRIVKVNVTVA